MTAANCHLFRPVTGRTHQLRVHAATPRHAGGLGAPIAGDSLYGNAASAPRLLLHADTLSRRDDKVYRVEGDKRFLAAAKQALKQQFPAHDRGRIMDADTIQDDWRVFHAFVLKASF